MRTQRSVWEIMLWRLLWYRLVFQLHFRLKPHLLPKNILLRMFISEEEQIKVTRGHVWRIRWMQHKNSVVLRQELLKNESRICQCVVVVKYYYSFPISFPFQNIDSHNLRETPRWCSLLKIPKELFHCSWKYGLKDEAFLMVILLILIMISLIFFEYLLILQCIHEWSW